MILNINEESNPSEYGLSNSSYLISTERNEDDVTGNSQLPSKNTSRLNDLQDMKARRYSRGGTLITTSIFILYTSMVSLTFYHISTFLRDKDFHEYKVINGILIMVWLSNMRLIFADLFINKLSTKFLKCFGSNLKLGTSDSMNLVLSSNVLLKIASSFNNLVRMRITLPMDNETLVLWSSLCIAIRQLNDRSWLFIRPKSTRGHHMKSPKSENQKVGMESPLLLSVEMYSKKMSDFVYSRAVSIRRSSGIYSYNKRWKFMASSIALAFSILKPRDEEARTIIIMYALIGLSSSITFEMMINQSKRVSLNVDPIYISRVITSISCPMCVRLNIIQDILEISEKLNNKLMLLGSDLSFAIGWSEMLETIRLLRSCLVSEQPRVSSCMKIFLGDLKVDTGTWSEIRRFYRASIAHDISLDNLNQSLVSAESECIHLTGNTFSTSYMMSMFNEGQVWSYHKEKGSSCQISFRSLMKHEVRLNLDREYLEELTHQDPGSSTRFALDRFKIDQDYCSSNELFYF